MNIKGLFEVAVKVKNLEKSSEFYTEILGFEAGLLDSARRWNFLWVSSRSGMVVLQEEKENWQQQHFSFRVEKSEIEPLKKALESKGVSVHGPVNLEWMQAVSLYFADPNGHALEFTAL